MKRSWKIALWLLGLTVALPAVVLGALLMVMGAREEQPVRAELPADSVVYDAAYTQAAAQALQLLQQAQRERHFPSVAAAVGVHGQLVWAGTAGYANVAADRAADVATRYYIASVSKLFTSVALGRLIDQGRIEFDASFRQLVPDFPPLQHDFTLRQLQQHQAGIRHWRWRDSFNRRDYRSVREAADDLQQSSLLFEPGTATSYSTPGYSLLALAMEQATGQDYLTLMQQLVFEPAGMRGVIADTAQLQRTNVVVPYFVHGRAMMRTPAFNLSDRWAGGGFLAAPADVVRFGNALLFGEMISPLHREALLARPVATARYPQAFSVEQSPLGVKVKGVGSGWGGRASLSLFPQQGIVVAIATNARPSDGAGNGIVEDDLAALFQAVAEVIR